MQPYAILRLDVLQLFTFYLLVIQQFVLLTVGLEHRTVKVAYLVTLFRLPSISFGIFYANTSIIVDVIIIVIVM